MQTAAAAESDRDQPAIKSVLQEVKQGLLHHVGNLEADLNNCYWHMDSRGTRGAVDSYITSYRNGCLGSQIIFLKIKALNL